ARPSSICSGDQPACASALRTSSRDARALSAASTNVVSRASAMSTSRRTLLPSPAGNYARVHAAAFEVRRTATRTLRTGPDLAQPARTQIVHGSTAELFQLRSQIRRDHQAEHGVEAETLDEIAVEGRRAAVERRPDFGTSRRRFESGRGAGPTD